MFPVAVLHLDAVVAKRRPASKVVASGGRLPHTAHHFLRKVLGVELVDTLDNGLHELSSRGVIGMFRDGHDADALASEHRLERDGVLTLAGEPGEFPNEDLIERSIGFRRVVDHLSKLRALGDAATFCLVDILRYDDVIVLFGVITKRPQLCRDGEIDVLPVTGDASVERDRSSHGRMAI